MAKRGVNRGANKFSFANLKYLFSRLLVVFSYIIIAISVVYLFTGYGDESIEFWTFISALWVLSILLFHVAKRFYPY